MPQLNPTPWLPMLVFTWLVFLTILPVKLMVHIFPNETTPLNTKKMEGDPWTWQWH